jgi:hypothetical protein
MVRHGARLVSGNGDWIVMIRALVFLGFFLSLCAPVLSSTPIQANVYTSTSQVTVNPTVSTTVYNPTFIVGGLLTFANATRSPATSGVLETINLAFNQVQTAAFDLCIFTARPASSYTDHVAMSISAPDKLLNPVCFSLTNNDSSAGVYTSYSLTNVGWAFDASGTSLYGILTTQGSPLINGPTDMRVSISVLLD